MTLRDQIERMLSPAMDVRAPYARIMVGSIVDHVILAMHRAGANCETIGKALGVPETRAIHDINRVLREPPP